MKNLNFILLVFIVTILGVQTVFAQTLPLGLYEGLMGNTGTALSDSTAPSYYNPSLLRNRVGDSFSLGGNTFGTLSSRSKDSEYAALNFSPAYLSSVLVGTNLVHEFFFTTLVAGSFDARLKSEAAQSTVELRLNLLQSRFGYSMAFRSLPFALQFLGRYSTSDTKGYTEATDPNTSVLTTSHVSSKFQELLASIGVSGHVHYEIYTLGFNYLSRGLSLLSKSQGTSKTFTHSGSTVLIEESPYQGIPLSQPGHFWTIGHEFKAGSHQFLTDSIFEESVALNNAYQMRQSFGYKMNSSSGHQFLVGINHLLGPQVKYFGQDYFTSVGYSWLTRALRSSIGLYYSSSAAEDRNFSAMGVSFHSEYAY
jgi:hypothetical protein